MAEKPSKRLRIAPLQKFTLEPVTDPAERAALERKFRQGGEGVVVRTRGGTAPKKATPSQVAALYKRLPERARVELLTRLVAELSSNEQRELVEQLLSRLPAEARQQVQEQIRGRTGER